MEQFSNEMLRGRLNSHVDRVLEIYKKLLTRDDKIVCNPQSELG